MGARFISATDACFFMACRLRRQRYSAFDIMQCFTFCRFEFLMARVQTAAPFPRLFGVGPFFGVI